MNSTQETKLGMYNAVISFCDEHPDVLASIPALQSALGSFKDAVENITATAQKESTVITGISEDKLRLRRKLAREASAISARVFAYANTVDNNDLKRRVNYRVSDLTRLKDELLPGICMNISEAANENLEALADYSITGDSIASLNNILEQYISAVPRPRNALSRRSAHSTALRELFRTADGILKNQVDRIVASLNMPAADFYEPYLNNRVIIEASTTSTQIKGVVTSKDNQEPLAGALITVAETGLTATTNSKGRFVIKTPSPGTYSIKVTRPGFIAKTITGLIVKLGQITTSHAEMAAGASE